MFVFVGSATGYSNTVTLNHRILLRRTRTIESLTSALSTPRFKGTIRVLLGYGNHIIIDNMNGSKRVNHGLTTALTSANAPTFFIRTTRTTRNSLNVVAISSIIVNVSCSNASGRLLAVIPVVGHRNTGFVSVAKGPRDSLTHRTSIGLGIRIPFRTYPLGLTPASSAATALTVNSTLTITYVRTGNFAGRSFTHSRPNNTLNHGLLARIGSIVHANRRIPIILSNAAILRTAHRVAGGRVNVATIISNSGGILNVFARNSLHQLVRRHNSVHNIGVSRMVAHAPTAVRPRTVTTSTTGVVSRQVVGRLLIVSNRHRLINTLRVRSLVASGIV